ncbi:MAG: hypothetical protein Q3M30_02810 [Candidatus Electrothrix sp. Rat3]|nr:hypothetical protein [Candidatus Electrothrix rattekaaiensis]
MTEITEFSYQEPAYLALGRTIYNQFSDQQNKGNVVSILSDAMTTLRQLGTIGLTLWIDSNSGERQFIRTALQADIAGQLDLSRCLTSEQQDIETAWGNIESLMQVLCYAKYYAKTREKQEGND